MKKRAKQLAMLGLTVTMMCGTQMTAFAADVENAPVPIETGAEAEPVEIKVEANEEEKADAKEEVVTGTEVAETPVVEETEVKETVAGTEELVGLGVSIEAEVETDAPVVPQTDVEADTPVAIPELDTVNKVAEPKLSISSDTTTFGTNGMVITLKADFDGEVVFFGNMLTLDGEIVGSTPEQVSDKEMRLVISKDDFVRAIQKNGYKNGQTAVLTTGYSVGYQDETGATKEVAFPTLTLTYSDGTVTPEPEKPQPEPEKPQPEPEKPQPEPEKPQPDGGNNGGTETPDPEKPEKPDGGNGNGEGTQKPDGNEQKPDGNEQKPDGNEQKPDGNEQKPDGNEQKPDGNEQKPDNTQKPEEQKPVSGQQVQTDNTTNKDTAPKTGDPTTALPFMGAGLSSLGVALGAFLKKRK